MNHKVWKDTHEFNALFAFFLFFLSGLLSLHPALMMQSASVGVVSPHIYIYIYIFWCFIFLFLCAVWFLLAKHHAESLKFAFLLVFALACSFSFYVFVDCNSAFVMLVLFCLGFLLGNSALKCHASPAVRYGSVTMGILFAVCSFLGSQLKRTGFLELFYVIDDAHRFLLLLTEFSALILFFTSTLMLVFTQILSHNQIFLCFNRSKPTRPALQICSFTLIILFSWLPYYFVCYPGILSPDSLSEVRQQLGSELLSNHHPWMHQLVIGACLQLGSSVMKGISLYSLLQMLLLSSCFACCVYYLRKQGASVFVWGCVLLYYLSFTVNKYYAITMWKDVVHGISCLALMLLLIIDVQSKKNEKKRLLIRSIFIFIFSFLFATFRNNGWYAFVLSFPLFILCNREKWKRYTAIFLCVCVVVVSYHSLIFDGMGIKKSSSGEMLSIPLQQIARTVKYDRASISPEDEHVLREFFYDLDNLGNIYSIYMSDPLKTPNVFNAAAFDSDPLRFAKCWFHIGMSSPLIYLEAFLLQNYGYWYTDITRHTAATESYENELGINHIPGHVYRIRELERHHTVLAFDSPLMMLYSLGLSVWIFAFAAALLLIKGQGKTASPMLIIGLYWFTTLASPVFCEYRYLYGLVVCVPLFFGLALVTPSQYVSDPPAV